LIDKARENQTSLVVIRGRPQLIKTEATEAVKQETKPYKQPQQPVRPASSNRSVADDEYENSSSTANIVLECAGHVFHAKKERLKKHSVFFRRILEDEKSEIRKSLVVTVPSPPHFELVLAFLYSGVVNETRTFAPETFFGVMANAEQLEVPDLIEAGVLHFRLKWKDLSNLPTFTRQNVSSTLLERFLSDSSFLQQRIPLTYSMMEESLVLSRTSSGSSVGSNLQRAGGAPSLTPTSPLKGGITARHYAVRMLGIILRWGRGWTSTSRDTYLTRLMSSKVPFENLTLEDLTEASKINTQGFAVLSGIDMLRAWSAHVESVKQRSSRSYGEAQAVIAKKESEIKELQDWYEGEIRRLKTTHNDSVSRLMGELERVHINYEVDMEVHVCPYCRQEMPAVALDYHNCAVEYEGEAEAVQDDDGAGVGLMPRTIYVSANSKQIFPATPPPSPSIRNRATSLKSCPCPPSSPQSVISLTDSEHIAIASMRPFQMKTVAPPPTPVSYESSGSSSPKSESATSSSPKLSKYEDKNDMLGGRSTRAQPMEPDFFLRSSAISLSSSSSVDKELALLVQNTPAPEVVL